MTEALITEYRGDDPVHLAKPWSVGFPNRDTTGRIVAMQQDPAARFETEEQAIAYAALYGATPSPRGGVFSAQQFMAWLGSSKEETP